jgi:hypothetical protein
VHELCKIRLTRQKIRSEIFRFSLEPRRSCTYRDRLRRKLYSGPPHSVQGQEFHRCTILMELTDVPCARTVAPPETKIPPSGDPARPNPKLEINERSPGQRVKEVTMNLESQWTVYRTRFLVRARQLTEPLVFTDALGREQSGRAGDYLVETSTGIRRITGQALFEDIYVPLAQSNNNVASGFLARPVSRASPEENSCAVA